MYVEGNFEIEIRNGIKELKPILEDGRVLLADGPDGTHYKTRPGIITMTNPLVFFCKHCKRTTDSYNDNPHLPDCTHPWANGKTPNEE